MRKNLCYEVYDSLNFDVPIHQTVCSFSRYLLRLDEMRQSVKIIKQCINLMPTGLVNNDGMSVGPLSKFAIADSM